MKRTNLFATLILSSFLFVPFEASAQVTTQSSNDSIDIEIPTDYEVPANIKTSAGDFKTPGEAPTSEIEATTAPSLSTAITPITATKAELISQLRLDMETAKDPNVIIIPLGPANERQLIPLDALTAEEIQSFLNKKQGFLTKLRKTLSFFRLKTNFINSVLREANSKFYESSILITRSNAKGGTLTVSLSGGLALPQKIMEKIKNTRIGRILPKKGGFYLMLAAGIGFSRLQHPDGKFRWTLELFHDYESLEHTLTGLADLTVALNPGMVYEHREGDFAKQDMTTIHGGPAGVFRQGANQFGWTGSVGIGVPPFLGSILIYQDRAVRYYWLRVSTAGIQIPALNYLMNWISNKISRKTKIATVPGLCHGALL